MRRLDGAGIDGPLAGFGAGFAQWLLSQGYTKSTVDGHLGLMGWLSRWLLEADLGADAVSEGVAHAFILARALTWPIWVRATAVDVVALLDMVDHEVLQALPHRVVLRVGDTVRRPTYPWTSVIHQLLRHLESVDFEYAPRVLGIDEQGREVLSFIEGESGRNGWSRVVDERGLVAMAKLLRAYHQAVAGFRPEGAVTWAAHTEPIGPDELVCHGDFGPWNLVWRGTRPVGILDWDYAWPTRPIHDVAYALEYVAPFRDDEECLRWLGYPQSPNRRRRLEIFAEAYGLSSTTALVDEVILQQEQVLDRARRLAGEGRQPQATWEAAGDLRAAAEHIQWSREHRHLFECDRNVSVPAAESRSVSSCQ